MKHEFDINDLEMFSSAMTALFSRLDDEGYEDIDERQFIVTQQKMFKNIHALLKSGSAEIPQLTPIQDEIIQIGEEIDRCFQIVDVTRKNIKLVELHTKISRLGKEKDDFTDRELDAFNGLKAKLVQFNEHIRGEAHSV